MRIAVVGGGPAGLFFARLVKRRSPSYDVRIFEQNPENATYGFGVTLAGSARTRLNRNDPSLLERLAASMIFNDEQAIVLNGDRVVLRYAAKGGAIPRLSLLRILEEACAEVGLTIEHERRVETREDLDGFDLVVAADGANSAIRGLYAEEFGVHTRPLGNRFAWYGVGRELKPNALVFKEIEGGCYVAHYYAYSLDMSTFVAECDEATWTRGGFSSLTDDERKRLFESRFADELDGAPLVENKSVWRNFQAITSDRWFHGKTVLIGDALRVAHPSIGSGTRLAMDDAAALADALAACCDDVPSALRLYVENRKPTRDLFTDATVRSFEWYEGVRKAMQVRSASDFALDFLTRTGRIDAERLKDYVPGFYRDHVAPAAAMGASHAS